MSTVTTQEGFTRYDIRVFNKFSWLLVKVPMQIHNQLSRVIGTKVPSIQTVRKVIRELSRNGRMNMHGDWKTHSGRPATVTIHNNIDNIRNVVETDRTLTCRLITKK